MKKILFAAALVLLAAGCQTNTAADLSASDSKGIKTVPEVLDSAPSIPKQKSALKDSNMVDNEPKYNQQFSLSDWNAIQTNITNLDGIPTESTIELQNRTTGDKAVIIRSTATFKNRIVLETGDDIMGDDSLFLDGKASYGSRLVFSAPLSGDLSMYYMYDMNTKQIWRIPKPQ